MEGAQAYDCKAFHPDCPDQGIKVVEVGGLAYLWCECCRVLCNLQAISPKFATYDPARPSNPLPHSHDWQVGANHG